MLISCSDCHRQYDVERMSAGEKILCLCGTSLVVEKVPTHEAKVIHCSGCGGVLKEDASECGYCGGAITIEERNLGDGCPECFARLRLGAKFCMQCGIEIKPVGLYRTPLSFPCPRCQGTLATRAIPGGEMTECVGCGGLWLTEGSFDEVVEKKDLAPVGKTLAEARATFPLQKNTIAYLNCPTCGKHMHRKNFGGCSGVIIDWCKGHGFWFDTHELEKIVEFARSGGLDRSRRIEVERQRSELRHLEGQKEFARTSSTGRIDGYTDVASGCILSGVLDFLGSTLKSWLR